MSPWPMHFVGTTREHYLMLFGAAGSIALLAGVVGAWIGAWMGARRATRLTLREDMPSHDAAVLGSDAVRLAQAVEAIAIEVERIAEGQRFTTRLLTERPLQLPDGRRTGASSITPH